MSLLIQQPTDNGLYQLSCRSRSKADALIWPHCHQHGEYAAARNLTRAPPPHAYDSSPSKYYRHSAGGGCTPFRATTVQPSPAAAAAASSFLRSSSAANASVHSSSCASGASATSRLGTWRGQQRRCLHLTRPMCGSEPTAEAPLAAAADVLAVRATPGCRPHRPRLTARMRVVALAPRTCCLSTALPGNSALCASTHAARRTAHA